MYAEELIANLRARRFIPIDQRAPGLPRALGAFFERGFAPRVEHRFASARELASAFERAVHERAPGREAPRGETPRPVAATTVRRTRPETSPLWLAAACAFGFALIAGGFFLRRAFPARLRPWVNRSRRPWLLPRPPCPQPQLPRPPYPRPRLPRPPCHPPRSSRRRARTLRPRARRRRCRPH